MKKIWSHWCCLWGWTCIHQIWDGISVLIWGKKGYWCKCPLSPRACSGMARWKWAYLKDKTYCKNPTEWLNMFPKLWCLYWLWKPSCKPACIDLIKCLLFTTGVKLPPPLRKKAAWCTGFFLLDSIRQPFHHLPEKQQSLPPHDRRKVCFKEQY